MDNTEQFNCISLCTGYAGIELGLERVIPNLRTVCYVEVEAFACANLVAKIEQGKLAKAPIWTDIKTFDGRPFRNRVHIITGGYPCQPFSNAGQRKGTDDPRHLWPYIAEHIRTIRPLWCFFENVRGHLTLGFEEVAQSLRDLGYSVEAGLFTAAEVGAPHKRERLFIMGYSCRCGLSGDTWRGARQVTEDGYSEQLADTCPQGLQGAIRSGVQRTTSQGQTIDPTRYDRWPSRPGQPQYEWEEPRVVADSEKQRQCRSKPEQGGRRCDGICTASGSSITRWPARPGQPQYDWEEPRTVESGVGRTVDGFASRVDELRLLGNGVVPQTAELAFRTLAGKFE